MTPRAITITIRPTGLPGYRITGLFASTTDAAIFALEQLGERQGSVSAKVAGGERVAGETP